MAKPTTAELIARIQAASALLPATYAAATKVAKTYEAYVWTLTVEAVEHKVGFGPQMLGTVGGAIKLPGAPVSISSRYTYADFAGAGVEVHAGVQVAGRSGVLHELDVSVLKADACGRARAGSELRSHHAKLGIEVKCYDGTLGPGVGRSILGLNSDTYCRLRLVTNTYDGKVAQMLAKRTMGARLIPYVRPAYAPAETAAVNALAALI